MDHGLPSSPWPYEGLYVRYLVALDSQLPSTSPRLLLILTLSGFYSPSSWILVCIVSLSVRLSVLPLPCRSFELLCLSYGLVLLFLLLSSHKPLPSLIFYRGCLRSP